MTVSLVERIVLVFVTLLESVQVRIVPAGRLVSVTLGIPGSTPVGLANVIPFLISKPMLPEVSSTTTELALYVKKGRNNDGILDGCDDGLELGTLDGFELGTLDGFALGLELGD